MAANKKNDFKNENKKVNNLEEMEQSEKMPALYFIPPKYIKIFLNNFFLIRNI